MIVFIQRHVKKHTKSSQTRQNGRGFPKEENHELGRARSLYNSSNTLPVPISQFASILAALSFLKAPAESEATLNAASFFSGSSSNQTSYSMHAPLALEALSLLSALSSFCHLRAYYTKLRYRLRHPWLTRPLLSHKPADSLTHL